MCTSSCPTPGAHSTWGECLRAKNLRIGYCREAAGGGDATAQRKWDAELAAYASARAQGVQPSGTKLPQIQRAMDWSEQTGTAFDAGATLTATDV